MIKRLVVLLLVSAACGSPPPIQTVAPVRAVPPQPMRDVSGNIVTVPVRLGEGTELRVQTLDFLSSQTAKAGDPVSMEVDADVLVNGAIAVAAGTPVRATIATVEHARRMGRSGNISLQLESTQSVDDQRVALRALKSATGTGEVGSVVALTLVVSPLFLLKRGDDVAYQPGTKITVYTNNDLTVNGWKR